jgi:hypothetical protein
MPNPKETHLDTKQASKRRKSPTSEQIREAMRNKYKPIGYKAKKGK